MIEMQSSRLKLLVLGEMWIIPDWKEFLERSVVWGYLSMYQWQCLDPPHLQMAAIVRMVHWFKPLENVMHSLSWDFFINDMRKLGYFTLHFEAFSFTGRKIWFLLSTVAVFNSLEISSLKLPKYAHSNFCFTWLVSSLMFECKAKKE